jgi:hypothetical protein
MVRDQGAFMPEWTLRPGEQIERKQLHDLFGGRRQGGIGPSASTPNVFLFTDPISGEQHGYIDNWQDDGCFHYTGEGQRGDQQMVSGNAAILKHVSEGRALRLFLGAGGQVVDDDQPFYTTDAPETGGGPIRSVIVFRLRPRTIATQAPTSKFELARMTSVTSVPVEEQFTERMFVEPAREPYEAERREARLALAFRDHLVSQGHAVTRLQILPEGEAKPIFTDLYVAATGLLVEVKGSVERGAIRMGLGQLLDYRRFVPNARCALLLPGKPRADLMTLIKSAGVGLFWPDGNGYHEELSSESLAEQPVV